MKSCPCSHFILVDGMNRIVSMSHNWLTLLKRVLELADHHVSEIGLCGENFVRMPDELDAADALLQEVLDMTTGLSVVDLSETIAGHERMEALVNNAMER